MKISKEKRDRVAEQILNYLFSQSPKAVFTSYIAKDIARDEEFVKKLLYELKKKGLVNEIKKNSEGIPYIRRLRWKLSDSAYTIYKQKSESY